MSRYNRLSVLSFSLLLGAIMGGAAHSLGLPPPFIEYAAKFACGPLAADSDVVIGQYATSINIHNPQATIPVQFIKKFVVALPEGRPPPPPVIKDDNLDPDLAERVDCPVIYDVLSLPADSHVEGFVVIEVAPDPHGQPVLDVVGKYTARDRAGQVSSFDVVVYPAQNITR